MGEYCENRIVTRNNPVLLFSIKKAYSVFIALLPVVMIYNVPIINKGFSTVFLGLFLPYAFIKIFKNIRFRPVIFVIIVWIGYMLFKSKGNASQIFLLFVVLIHILAAFNSSLNYPVMRKTIEYVAVVCTALVLIQTVLYYLFGISFKWLIKYFILEDNQYYLIDPQYKNRPSAIFLEPSHYTQYCSLGLLSVLFPLNSSRANMKKAVWIALGCILTTSGMGIALVAGIFAWYALFNRKQKGGKIIGIVGWIIAGIAAYFILMQFSFFSMAVQRVFGEVNGYNAIWGRTLYWDSTVGSMTGSDLIWGYGTLDLPEGYMTGLMSVIYQYGLVGLVLMVLTFILLMMYSKNNYSVCCCVIFLVLLPLANNTGFISLVFRISVIIAGGYFCKSNKLLSLKAE